MISSIAQKVSLTYLAQLILGGCLTLIAKSLNISIQTYATTGKYMVSP